jgi:DNA-binding CsgD family transcriptional regulator
LSAEVVDYVGIWPAVAWLVGPLHDHAREPALVAACQQPAVGVVASDVYACDDSIEAAHGCELLTRVQESLEASARVWSWAYRSELDKGGTASCFASSAVANGKPRETGPPDEVPRIARARIRLDTGEWLLVHAAKLERGGGKPTGEVAVMIERARPGQVVSLLIRAYGLSERETDVVQGVLQGLSTAEIGHATYLSPYTVQDFVKSVFQKVGVRSRRELVAKIFAEYHWPRYGNGDAKLGPDGWFAELRSAASSA